MKVLLIGGAGFLGTNLAEALLDAGHDVHLLDRAFASRAGAAPLAVSGRHETDIGDDAAIARLLDALGIDCVVNLASSLLPSSEYAAFDAEFRNMMLPGFQLLNHIASRKIRYVYFSSGGAIYGDTAGKPCEESSRLQPINHYGYSKMLFEQYIEFVSRTAGLDYLIVRPSNPYGPHQNPNRKQGLIAVAVDKIVNRQPIEIWGDGSIVRDFVWVGDLARAVTALIGSSMWNATYNVGSGIGASVKETIALIEAIVGVPADVVYKPARQVDAPSIVLDISRLQSTVEYRPIDLPEGLEKYFKTAYATTS
ncbi:NAD-dependent epimerase/dehydratase family protein [Massilia phyllosphaerae]|uniref:NAD-dependent epimerase/dehydratase family protein n=1 Tax=Massilia phyllosphaerae TaxID=3106034 RepID=UPI002B1CAC71|nr:NAD-dependent epimerase/dehydratase family protein [Massilia sp. SGZ-792]